MAGCGIRRNCENCNNQVEVKQYIYYCKFGEKAFQECQIEYPEDLKAGKLYDPELKDLILAKDRFVLLDGY